MVLVSSTRCKCHTTEALTKKNFFAPFRKQPQQQREQRRQREEEQQPLQSAPAVPPNDAATQQQQQHQMSEPEKLKAVFAYCNISTDFYGSSIIGSLLEKMDDGLKKTPQCIQHHKQTVLKPFVPADVLDAQSQQADRVPEDVNDPETIAAIINSIKTSRDELELHVKNGAAADAAQLAELEAMAARWTEKASDELIQRAVAAEARQKEARQTAPHATVRGDTLRLSLHHVAIGEADGAVWRALAAENSFSSRLRFFDCGSMLSNIANEKERNLPAMEEDARQRLRDVDAIVKLHHINGNHFVVHIFDCVERVLVIIDSLRASDSSWGDVMFWASRVQQWRNDGDVGKAVKLVHLQIAQQHANNCALHSAQTMMRLMRAALLIEQHGAAEKKQEALAVLQQHTTLVPANRFDERTQFGQFLRLAEQTQGVCGSSVL